MPGSSRPSPTCNVLPWHVVPSDCSPTEGCQKALPHSSDLSGARSPGAPSSHGALTAQHI
jgi:hypothetical protein